MPKKVAPEHARKRTKTPGKIADLPVKSLKGKDAAAVKGGQWEALEAPWYLQRPEVKLTTQVNQLDPNQLNTNTTLKINRW